MQKHAFIKDGIWGEVRLFPWEKELISTSAFSRLHYVIQNASAFRIYPSLSHSRFSHSIGVLYTASQITKNLFLNLDLSFDKRGKIIWQDPEKNTNHPHHIDNPFRKYRERLDLELHTIDSALGNHAEWIDQPKTGKPNIVELLTNNLGAFPRRYSLAYGIVRIAALIHDIGHLPYSHTFENAIVEYIAENNDISNRDLTNVISTLLESSGLALHELMGSAISAELSEYSSELGFSPELQFLLPLARSLVFTNQYPILKSIISGPADADRVDYVRRDGETSGFQASAVDYDRFFHSISILPIEQPHSQASELDLDNSSEKGERQLKLAVLPSKRAATDVERLLRERFLAYRYIYNHHKVRLYDLITQRCVLKLAHDKKCDWIFQRLQQLVPLIKKSKPFSAEPFETEEAKRAIKCKEFVQVLETKMNDNWLRNEIGNLWNKALEPSINDTSSTPLDQWLYASIICIVKDRGRFRSGFKSPEEFWLQMKNFGISIPGSVQEMRNLHRDLGLRDRLPGELRELELELMDRHGTLVLFGLQRGPDSIGVSAEFLESYGLRDRCSDLTNLSYQSPFINFWFWIEKGESESSPNAIEAREKILNHMREALTSLKKSR